MRQEVNQKAEDFIYIYYIEEKGKRVRKEKSLKNMTDEELYRIYRSKSAINNNCKTNLKSLIDRIKKTEHVLSKVEEYAEIKQLDLEKGIKQLKELKKSKK